MSQLARAISTSFTPRNSLCRTDIKHSRVSTADFLANICHRSLFAATNLRRRLPGSDFLQSLPFKGILYAVSPPSASKAGVATTPILFPTSLSAFDRAYCTTTSQDVSGWVLWLADLRSRVRVWLNHTCSDYRGLRGLEVPARNCLQMLSLVGCAVLKLHPLSPAIRWKPRKTDACCKLKHNECRADLEASVSM